MARNRQLNVNLSSEEMELINKLQNETGLSKSNLIMEGLELLSESNPRLKELSKDVKIINIIRKAKEAERMSGDYLGSFDKMEQKIQRIEICNIPDFMKEKLIKDTKLNYTITQKAFEDSKTGIHVKDRLTKIGKLSRLPSKEVLDKMSIEELAKLHKRLGKLNINREAVKLFKYISNYREDKWAEYCRNHRR